MEEPPQGAISIYRCMRCVQRSLLERMHPWLLVVLEFRHAIFVCTLLTNCCHGLNTVPSVILVLAMGVFLGGILRGVCVTRAPSSQTSSHALMRELDRGSLTLDLACGRAQQDSKSHHPSPGLSASTKIRNTLLFLTDNVVLAAQVDKDNWLISQSRKEAH